MTGLASREDLDSGVGVLGWFGFILVNLAALGIIGISSSLSSWHPALCCLLAYTAALVLAAVVLERRGGAKSAPFINLLWVLGCGFVLVSGTYLSYNVFDSDSPWDRGDGAAAEPLWPSVNLSSYLPPGSSSDLRDWADGATLPVRPNLINFQGFVFFPAMAAGADFDDDSHRATALAVLWHSDGKTNKQVAPELYEPGNLVIVRDQLFFAAHSNFWSDCSQLYSIGSVGADATPAADLEGGEEEEEGGNSTASSRLCIESMQVDSDEEVIYIRAKVRSGRWGDRLRPRRLFRSDGTRQGTQRLDKPQHEEEEETSTSAEPSEGKGSDILQMPGVLLFGDLPMLGLSVWVLAQKKLPGVSVNIFLGGWVFAVMLVSIIIGRTDEPPMQFIKWFSAIYSAFCYIGIIFIHIRDKENLSWLQELVGWLLVPVSITFFCAIHGVLELSAWELDNGLWFLDGPPIQPSGDGGWWFLYFLMIILQVAASLMLHRTLPMVLAAIGLLEVAWRISGAVVSMLFGKADSDMALIAFLFILALQGCGIIIAAFVYAGRRERIEGKVRELLLRGSGSKLLPAEQREGDENFE